MYEISQETQFGIIRYACAGEGKKILIGNQLTDMVAMGKNSKLEDFIEIDDGHYVPPINDSSPSNSNILEVQENQIKLSKSNLSTYLEENPLFSTVKYEDGRYYNVTLEKQYSLMDRLVKHTIFNGTKPLYWNSVGDTSEIWEYEELLQLSTEIEDYVSPLVELQRQVEVRIRECKSQHEVLSIDINPYKEVAMRLNEINTLNNK